MVQPDMLTVDDTWRAALAARRRAFRALHERGCFVIPNPWDVGSARYLQHLGFKALATTSAGFAFSQGLPDFDLVVSRDRSLAHIGEIATAVDVPVNADFSSGYGREPSDVADSVMRCVATGVAGLSIEDATGEPAAPLYDLSLAVERVGAAREAIDRALGCFWLHELSASTWATPIRSGNPFDDSRPTRRPAPTCSLRRVRKRPTRSKRSWKRSGRNRSTSSLFATSGSASTT
jgi:hypothetical protein